MLDTIAYPEFVPNQILTDRQLNQLRAHLEQQDRLTRIRTTGAGIVCGLHARRGSAPSLGVEVALGYGVTSDGDLIELCATTTYTHSRKYVDPDLDEDGKLRYLPWRDPADAKAQIDIIELIPREVMEGDDPPAADVFTNATLTAALSGRVVVLYLEHEPVDLNSCLVTSCDNKGRNINVHVRALLVRKVDLTAAAGCPVARAIHRVPRLHTRGVPQPGTTADQIRDAFSALVAGNAPVVSSNIKALFDAYAPFLDLPPIAADPLGGKLTGAHIAQYRYDALVDFAAAYNEAAAAAHTLVTACCPAGTFPRHLMLGVLDGSSGAGFRNALTPAAVRNVMDGGLDRVRDLFRRLEAMAVMVDLDAHPGPASLRPSHTAAFPLGRRARPFYFSAADIEPLWRPRRRCSVDPDWPWRQPPTATALDTDYAESTFLRIEGHVGDAGEAARAAIIAKRDEGNAEFHVLCSYINDGSAAEQQRRADIRNLLRVPREKREEATKAFEQFVAFGETSFEPIASLALEQREWIRKLQDATEQWVATRERRRLHCDPAELVHDYLQARGELLCLLQRARGIVRRVLHDVALVPDASLTGEGLARMLEGAPFVLVDQFVGAVLAAPGDWDTVQKVEDQLRESGAVSDAAALRHALRVALRALDASLDRVAALALPRRVSAFDYDVLALVYRETLAHSYEVWHWMRALGVPIPGAQSDGKPGDAPLHGAEAPVMAADWLGLHGCLPARFGTMFAAYDAVRTRDLSLFRNLAVIDGLEHLAGVSKGGTFILVCDTPLPGGKVVADFSLDGCLPCCCAFDPEPLCLPPLAAPDVRVVTLTPAGDGEGFAPFTIDIDVAGNDCDLNGPPPAMEIEQISERSEHGAQLTFRPDRGVVTYTSPDAPTPGLVDRFTYGLRQTGDCQGTAVGRVVVIYAIAPVLTGRIEGDVTVGDEAAVGATVRIVETGATTPTVGLKARYAFDQVQPGTYTLEATRDTLKSDPVVVQVEAGEIARAFLVLRETIVVGSIVVRVRDIETGAPLPKADVQLTSRGGDTRPAVTDDKGVAVFQDLSPDTWAGVASRDDYLAGQVGPITLAAGQTVPVDVALQRLRVSAPSDTVVLVAGSRGVPLLEANRIVRVAVDDRYRSYLKTFNAATDDPRTLTSEEYKAAAAFLGETVGNPAMSEEAVAEAYKETSTTLAAAARDATGDEKAAYQAALTAITAAYFDRVALANPETLPGDRVREVQEAVATVEGAGIAVDTVKTLWNGDGLKSSTGIGSTDAIGQVLG